MNKKNDDALLFNQMNKNSNSEKFGFSEILTTVLFFLYYCVRGILLFFVPKRLLYKNVRGSNVLITGAGSGLGQGLSLEFCRLGAIVVGVDLNLDGLKRTQKLIKKINGKFYFYQCDISQPENVYKMANQVEKEVGFISILINNAGVVTGKYFLNIDENEIYKTFAVNTFANFWTCRAFLPSMRERNFGHIVTVSSLSGLTGAVKLVDYCASKFAAVGFLESLRIELNAEGLDKIKSTCVCPFFISTGMFQGAHSRFIPILEVDYAVKKIISAILSDQKLLIMPRIFYFMNFFRSFLPTEACDLIYKKIGGYFMMNDFIGRIKENQSIN